MPGWEDRSTYVAREGRLGYYHFDLVAQALAKLERAHSQDLADVEAMLGLGLIDRGETRVAFEQIEAELFRFPAIDPASFRQRVEDALA